MGLPIRAILKSNWSQSFSQMNENALIQMRILRMIPSSARTGAQFTQLRANPYEKSTKTNEKSIYNNSYQPRAVAPGPLLSCQ